MIILSNCLTQTADEGCSKLAVNLTEHIRRLSPHSRVIAYGKPAEQADLTLSLNKWMLSRKLAQWLRKEKQPLLFIPSPAKMLPLAIRTYILSRYTKETVAVVLAMPMQTGRLARLLFKKSGAHLITVSQTAYNCYTELLGERVHYVKMGVDLTRFSPVSLDEKTALREKYGLPADKPIVLHVGHLKTSRGISVLLHLEEDMHGVLVASTQTAHEQDAQLRRALEQRPNVTVIDDFLPDIQELYALADAYLFPVTDKQACIDTPLSVLEAAACDLPIATTVFGETASLLDNDGFFAIPSLDPIPLNQLLRTAMSTDSKPRNAVLEYDWQTAAATLRKLIEKDTNPSVLTACSFKEATK